MLKNIAIILAGGVGERMRLDTPKQFIKLAGLPIIEHTINVFENSKKIDEIIVVVHPKYQKKFSKILTGKYKKITKLVAGGGNS